MEGLRKRRAPGRPSRLSQDQLKIVAELYQLGPRAAGFDANRWTTARFADAIQQRFGVRYDPDHVGRIMHRLGLRERTRRSAPELVPALPVVGTPAPEVVSPVRQQGVA